MRTREAGLHEQANAGWATGLAGGQGKRELGNATLWTLALLGVIEIKSVVDSVTRLIGLDLLAVSLYSPHSFCYAYQVIDRHRVLL